METVSFFKMSGSGNDFIIIDNRSGIVNEQGLKDFIVNVCRRKMSVGADGLILIENSEKVDFKWRFYNSDGSRAEMCGNGARCAARFAVLNGIAGENLSFETDAGIVSAEVIGDRAKVKMPDPGEMNTEVRIDLQDGPLSVSRINTGVPHVVIESDQLEQVDVFQKGREIRYHPAFAPAGTNVNFVARRETGSIAIRTYERGVEDETLACGTGSIAAALVTAETTGWPSPVRVRTRSGIELKIYFTRRPEGYENVHLEGDARVVYRGQLFEDAYRQAAGHSR
jgi:diaminopimelate epimerase